MMLTELERPSVFTHYTNRVPFFRIIGLIVEAARLMSDDERIASFDSLGSEAGAMVFDCLCQSSARAHFVNRMRSAIHYNNTATKDVANLHARTLRAAKLAVVSVSTMEVRNGMPIYNKPGHYVCKPGFYFSLRGARRFNSKSGAISAARAQMADHADKYFPTQSYTTHRKLSKGSPQ